MKLQHIVLGLALLTSAAASAQLKSEWAEKVTPDNVWQEYPRPNMVRADWQNLNGEWNYAITPVNSAKPSAYDGKILVPFAVESQLSGVGKRVGENNELWYNRTFKVPSAWNGKDVLLNFGAVDWRTTVWVNGVQVGTHEGGYAPFSFNITDALRKGDNELTVRVYDPTDKGTQPRGKQISNPNGIWYTPVTGIWQTVWLEPVAKNHIAALKITPDVDAKELNVMVDAPAGVAKVEVLDGDKVVASGSAPAGENIEISMPADMKLWDTKTPNIYDLKVTLAQNGKTVDKVDSYAAMRKVGMRRDKDGVIRFTLNDKDIFHFGPLDQGWWPDGLYTAPSYEAMVYDIDKTKDLGFNMIRKHIKIEPALWYEYCDRNGVLVWQDMPSADHGSFNWQNHNYFRGPERVRSEESDRQFRTEWQEIMDKFHNYPSIVVWVPFNEGWGQYNTKEIVKWTKDYDPSRLVNAASGGNFFYDAGDIMDVHNYPAPRIYLLSDDQANVIGEYGGIGRPVEGHLWQDKDNWGYIQFPTAEAVTNEYLKYIDILRNLAKIAYTGAVYTQTTDVEVETNGFMTYDRKVMKVDEKKVAEANRKVIEDFSQK